MANQLYGICSWFKSKSTSSTQDKEEADVKKKLNKESRSLYKMRRRRSLRHCCVCVCTSFFGCHQKYAAGMLINQKYLKCWIQKQKRFTNNRLPTRRSVLWFCLWPSQVPIRTNHTINIQSPCAKMKIWQNKRIPRRKKQNMTWDCDVHTKPCEN